MNVAVVHDDAIVGIQALEQVEIENTHVCPRFSVSEPTKENFSKKLNDVLLIFRALLHNIGCQKAFLKVANILQTNATTS